MFIFPLLVQEWGELWPAVPAELSLCRARVQRRVPGCLRGQGAAGPARLGPCRQRQVSL